MSSPIVSLLRVPLQTPSLKKQEKEQKLLFTLKREKKLQQIRLIDSLKQYDLDDY